MICFRIVVTVERLSLVLRLRRAVHRVSLVWELPLVVREISAMLVISFDEYLALPTKQSGSVTILQLIWDS